nr:hypothetical protein [Neobacillus sp. Marseille-Q6967]
MADKKRFLAHKKKKRIIYVGDWHVNDGSFSLASTNPSTSAWLIAVGSFVESHWPVRYYNQRIRIIHSGFCLESIFARLAKIIVLPLPATPRIKSIWIQL